MSLIALILKFNSKQFKKIVLEHDRISNVVNDKFDIQGIDSTEIKIHVYVINNSDNKKLSYLIIILYSLFIMKLL